ncbi:MAG: STAS domain-containing protein [Planctomycetota bacterium]
MKIDKLIYEHFAELRLRGEFDTFYCPKLVEEVDKLVQEGMLYVILNLRLVKFINSTALGAIIKSYKRFKAEGGDLCIAEPSRFTRDVLTKVGVDRIVPMFDDLPQAQEYLLSHLQEQGLVDVIGESQVLFAPADPALAGLVRHGKGLGTVLSVDHERIRFRWSGSVGVDTPADDLARVFPRGSEVDVKFQVKLCKKGFFEVRAKVLEVETGDEDGRAQVVVTAQFQDLPEGDRLALAQFADDLDYLKRQLEGM